MVVKKKLELHKEREEFIARGGHVIADIIPKEKNWMLFSLRIKCSMLEHIERLLEDRPGMTKTGWILEAVQEKIKNTK